MQRICKNCRLFNEPDGTCSIRILHQGVVWRDIPVDPNDECLWEELGIADHIQQVRFWVEDDNGEPTKGNGTVKIEYPPGFFGSDQKSEF